MKKFYGVYTQFEPTHKYEEELVSIWSTKEAAVDAGKRLAEYNFNDFVWIQPVSVDYECLFNAEIETEKDDHILIKPKKDSNE